MDISVLFVGLPEWNVCTICAVLSGSIQPELRTNCSKCYAVIILEKNLILVEEEKQVEDPPQDDNMMIDSDRSERITAFLERSFPVNSYAKSSS